MRKRITFVTLVLFLSSLIFPYTYEKGFHKELKIGNLTNIYLKNVNGKILINSQEDEKISIFATIKANSKEKLDLVNIKVFKSDKALEIKPYFPKNSNVSINFILKIPPNLASKITSVNGSIISDANLKRFIFTTVNGKILVTNHYGAGKVSTVNGSIKLYLGELKDNLSVKTVNGSISVYIKNTKNLSLKASTVNGSVKIDHPDLIITYKKRLFPFSSFSTIKAAGKEPEFHISLSTVNGSIRVLPY